MKSSVLGFYQPAPLAFFKIASHNHFVHESGRPSISQHFPNNIVLLSIGALASKPNFTARYSLTPNLSCSALQRIYLHSRPTASSYQVMKSSISKTSQAVI